MRVLIPYYFILVCLLTIPKASAQTVPIADPAFRQFLVDNYPSVMSGSQELDTALAQTTVNGTIDCSNLGITEFHEVDYFKLIDSLIATNNSLDSMGNMKELTSLDYIDVSNNQLRYLPDVRNIGAMRFYYVQNNLAEEIPWMNSLADTMEIIDASNNNLMHLYDFDSFTKLSSMDIRNNYLTFKWLLRNVDHPSFASVFQFDPQKPWPVASSDTVKVGNDFYFDLDTPDDTVTTNMYRWYKDGNLFRTTTSDSIIVSGVSDTSAGVYTVEITNSHPLLTSLTITTTPLTLVIEPCLDLSNLTYNIVGTSCDASDGQISIDTTTIVDGMAHYSITLMTSEDSIETNQTGVFNGLSKNKYHLLITDQNGCSANSINYHVDHKQSCDLVLSPNGDGSNDVLYINDSGTAEIYSRWGQVLATFNGESSWDGTKENGELVPPGYYVIYLNGKRYRNLTILW